MEAVYQALEQEKIGALGFDVIEDEGLLRTSKNSEECPPPILEKLLKHENVIFTGHAAFYTDEAVSNISSTTVDNLYSYATTDKCEHELVK